MLTSTDPSIGIIGAGLGGLTLALSLHARSLTNIQIFELRSPDYELGGAIMLSPNALRILDKLGVYSEIAKLGFNFDTLTLKSDPDLKTTGRYYFGDKKMYGYRALRLYRRDIMRVLREAVSAAGIDIVYERKFSSVVEETFESVTYEFADGQRHTTNLLIGADGIHSKVRAHFYPDLTPTYAGFMGVSYAFPSSKLRLPTGQEKDYAQPVSFLNPKTGGYVMAPQSHDGSEMFAGRQFRYSLPTSEDGTSARNAWDALLKDKTELIRMLQENSEAFSGPVQSALEAASTSDAHSLSIWPFHVVPKMPKWSSASSRVIILGDAAHAVPPTAGQGANQAFEDAMSLSYLIKSTEAGDGFENGLKSWVAYRQGRIDRVLQLNEQMNTLRLSDADKEALMKEGKMNGTGALVMGENGDLAWLYGEDVEASMTRELKRT